MKIAVIHDTLNPCGGAERLSLYMIRALNELGCDIDLITIEPTRWRKIKELFGDDFRRYISGERIIAPFKKLSSIYGRYIEWFLRDIVDFVVKIRSRYDLTLITKQLHLPTFADVIYIHFPDFYPDVETLYYPERYVYNAFFRMYSLPSHMMSRLLIEISKRIRYKPLVLTNSTFSKVLIKRWLGVNAHVVYPPVNLEKFKTHGVSNNFEKKENLVVTVGRIERAKNLHIIPMLASKLPHFKFVIMGSLVQKDYLSYLIRLIDELQVTDRVEIIPGVDEDTLIRMLAKARYYLHTTPYEHFGMAVVEAMAMGAIPIVHTRSGAWIDILAMGKFGYGYQKLEDIVRVLNESPKNPFEYELCRKVMIRARLFSYDMFKSRIKFIVERLIEHK